MDAAKFMAAVGVIWIHTCQTPSTTGLASLGRFAVPFFTAAAGYLMVLSLQRKADVSLWSFAASRLQRLYLPFLAWSGIYVAFRWAKTLLFGGNESALVTWDIFILGGAYHLWFIPYLLVASIAGFLLIRFVNGSCSRQQNAATICYVIGLILAIILNFGDETNGVVPLTAESEHVLAFMAMATPAFLWGLSLGWLQSANFSQQNRACFASSSLTIILSLTVIFLVTTMLTFASGRSALLESASGLALLLLAIYGGLHFEGSGANNVWLEFVRKLGQISFGIYFSHLVFIKVAEVFAAKLDVSDSVQTTTALFVVVVISSVIFSLIANRIRATRWLVA